MNRTKLADRPFADYTRGEEIMNMVTHIVGAALGVIALMACVAVAAKHHNPWGAVSGVIYGTSLIALYTVSSVYHGLHKNTGKKVMQVIDHCTIFGLIAGSYTPVLLSGIRPTHPILAWVYFGVVIAMSAVGIVFTAIDHHKYAKFSMACYIAIGWIIILAVKPTIEIMTFKGFLWLLAGGISYTIGAVLYGIGKKKGVRYIHSVFHIFVVLGSVLQFFPILWYAM